jgi:hypothetical protein
MAEIDAGGLGFMEVVLVDNKTLYYLNNPEKKTITLF